MSRVVLPSLGNHVHSHTSMEKAESTLLGTTHKQHCWTFLRELSKQSTKSGSQAGRSRQTQHCGLSLISPTKS